MTSLFPRAFWVWNSRARSRGCDVGPLSTNQDFCVTPRLFCHTTDFRRHESPNAISLKCDTLPRLNEDCSTLTLCNCGTLWWFRRSTVSVAWNCGCKWCEAAVSNVSNAWRLNLRIYLAVTHRHEVPHVNKISYTTLRKWKSNYLTCDVFMILILENQNNTQTITELFLVSESLSETRRCILRAYQHITLSFPQESADAVQGPSWHRPVLVGSGRASRHDKPKLATGRIGILARSCHVGIHIQVNHETMTLLAAPLNDLFEHRARFSCCFYITPVSFFSLPPSLASLVGPGHDRRLLVEKAIWPSEVILWRPARSTVRQKVTRRKKCSCNNSCSKGTMFFLCFFLTPSNCFFLPSLSTLRS